MSVKIPYTLETLEDEETAIRARLYKSPSVDMIHLVKVRENGVLLNDNFKNIAEKIYNFQVRPDDIFLITFGKSGTTWMQVMWVLDTYKTILYL